jgi:CheY-like chemotaxis protein
MTADKSPSPPQARTEVAPRRVLVVDDQLDASASLAYLLTLHGHRAKAVSSGLSALAAVDGFTPDVCLMDIRMPGMSGYELADRLRRAFGPGLRLLAVTGELSAAADPRAAELFEQVFAKPLDMDELLRVVDGSPSLLPPP